MTPKELSYLCCDRWLSSDHMNWMASKLNEAQKDTLCVYINHVGSIPRFLRKRIKLQLEKPTKLMFLLNVGKDENQNVFVGSDLRRGNQWTICHVDSIAKIITYGDSMGWELPDSLSETVGGFLETLWGEGSSVYSVVCCHIIPSTVPAMAMFVERLVLHYIHCNHVEVYVELLL